MFWLVPKFIFIHPLTRVALHCILVVCVLFSPQNLYLQEGTPGLDGHEYVLKLEVEHTTSKSIDKDRIKPYLQPFMFYNGILSVTSLFTFGHLWYVMIVFSVLCLSFLLVTRISRLIQSYFAKVICGARSHSWTPYFVVNLSVVLIGVLEIICQ